MNHWIGRVFSIVCVAVLLLMNWNAQAITGDLDPSFGHEGKVTTDFFHDNDVAVGLLIRPDGKTVVAGYARNTTMQPGYLALVRYNTDGSLDSSFGNGGKVLHSELIGGTDCPKALALQPDGKFIFAGSTYLGNTSYALAVTRFNENGSLDTGFGVNGTSVMHSSDYTAVGNALAVLPDGKILAAGYRIPYETMMKDFIVMRLNADGSLDQTFGSGGRVITDFLGSHDMVTGLLVQPDGKIVATGIVHNYPFGQGNFGLARYNSDGTPDAAFGSNGKVITPIAYEVVQNNPIPVALQPDGKLVVAGGAVRAPGTSEGSGINDVAPVWNEMVAIARYNKDGSLDADFGEGGKVLRAVGTIGRVRDMALQPDGKILIVGYSGTAPAGFPSIWNLMLSRYYPDGGLDIDFKLAEASDKAVKVTYGSALALRGEKITVAGQDGWSDGSADFLLLRYDAGPIVPQPNFTLASQPRVVNALRGEKVAVAIGINRFNNFSGTVTVSAPDTSSLKIKVKNSAISTTEDSVTFILKIKGSAPAGNHALSFLGKDDAGKERTIKVLLVIE